MCLHDEHRQENISQVTRLTALKLTARTDRLFLLLWCPSLARVYLCVSACVDGPSIRLVSMFGMAALYVGILQSTALTPRSPGSLGHAADLRDWPR